MFEQLFETDPSALRVHQGRRLAAMLAEVSRDNPFYRRKFAEAGVDVAALSAALPVTWSPLLIYFGITLILALLDWPSLGRAVRSKLLSLREEANAAAPKGAAGEPAFRISVNDLIIKAWAAALQRVPAANAVWAEDRILRFQHSDIGIAVAIEAVPVPLTDPLFRVLVREEDAVAAGEVLKPS